VGQGGRGFRGGRGRGRGNDRGGRGRGGRGGKPEYQDQDRKDPQRTPGANTMANLSTPEEKLSAMLGHISKFIKVKLDNDQLSDDYTYPRN
jgi:hypothetical protein